MSNEATIRRGVRNARYAAIPNHVFEDARLSMEARWLLSYLLSKPDNWTVVIGDIIKKGNCGRDKARGMIAELVKWGYAEREQQRADGKFGSSVLVIYDEPKDLPADGGQGDGGTVAFLPQTDLPAAAEPAPAPPSPAKSAHSNNLDSANTDNQQGRESASADCEDPKKIERDFKRWFPTWPTYVADSEPAARKAWGDLTAGERSACLARTGDYIAAVKAVGRQRGWPAAGVYLARKEWEKLSDPKSDIAAPSVHNPFSKAWSARRIAELLQPEATTMPALTEFQRRQVAEGGAVADRLVRERRQKYGWPKVNVMHDRARSAQGCVVPVDVLAVSEAFVRVHRDSDDAAAWMALHDRMGWPWLPMTGHEWFFFPPGDPATAIENFRAAINEGRDDDAQH